MILSAISGICIPANLQTTEVIVMQQITKRLMVQSILFVFIAISSKSVILSIG